MHLCTMDTWDSGDFNSSWASRIQTSCYLTGSSMKKRELCPHIIWKGCAEAKRN